jgi:hypothetical protein
MDTHRRKTKASVEPKKIGNVGNNNMTIHQKYMTVIKQELNDGYWETDYIIDRNELVCLDKMPYASCTREIFDKKIFNNNDLPVLILNNTLMSVNDDFVQKCREHDQLRIIFDPIHSTIMDLDYQHCTD